MNQNLSLYFHIPFCRYICHYCDFAKTANFQQDHIATYMEVLLRQLTAFIREFYPKIKVQSVFFGGGTPGILVDEYAPLMNFLEPYLAEGAEISLEANPDDISSSSLNSWRSMGFNRISLGVQSFSPVGLQVLTRRHSSEKSLRVVEKALSIFENLNIDLIYGWQGQSVEDWEEDLSVAMRLGVPHLSLYNLTFEPGTVFGRKQRRGLVDELDDSSLEAMYTSARTMLAEAWHHDEVSNWSKSGFSCRHNWVYWQDQAYLAFGCGGHGYLPEGPWGLRYAWPKSLRTFLNKSEKEASTESISDFLRSQGAILDEGRGARDWLLETVGSGFRSSRGVNIADIEKVLNCNFVPSAILKRGIETSLVRHVDNYVTLIPKEWFRESRWALELADSFPL